jgi:hypothetical protein
MASIGPDDITDTRDMQWYGARRNRTTTPDIRDLFELFLLELLADTGCAKCQATGIGCDTWEASA